MKIYSIYEVTNKLNNKKYIGFATNFIQRKSQHKTDYPKKDFIFYRAIRKYGWENFEWKIIYQSLEKEHTLKTMEPHFINELKTMSPSGYNMTAGGQRGPDTIKRKPLTEEQRKNVSEGTKKAFRDRPELLEDMSKRSIEMWKDEYYRKNQSMKHKGLPSPNKGKKASVELRKHISEKMKEMWRDEVIREKILKHMKNPTKETREKMSRAKLGKPSWNKGISPKKESIEKQRNKISKNWKIITPSGDDLIITNLNRYCKSNNIPFSSLQKIAGTGKTYKGFLIERL